MSKHVEIIHMPTLFQPFYNIIVTIASIVYALK